MTSVAQTQKIFVEPEDEIVFIIEKILTAPSSRVVLVVPATATIISSSISLKLLTRKIIELPKLLVLVTDNPVGIKLAERAGLVVRNKVSEVDKQAWREALVIKEDLLRDKQDLKEELLQARNIRAEEAVSDDLAPEDPIAENEVEIEEVSENDPQTEEKSGKQIETEIHPDTEKVKGQEEVFAAEQGLDSDRDETKKQEGEPEQDEESPLPITTKPRIPAKKVNVKGITFLAGGDISMMESQVAAQRTTSIAEASNLSGSEINSDKSSLSQNSRTGPKIMSKSEAGNKSISESGFAHESALESKSGKKNISETKSGGVSKSVSRTEGSVQTDAVPLTNEPYSRRRFPKFFKREKNSNAHNRKSIGRTGAWKKWLAGGMVLVLALVGLSLYYLSAVYARVVVNLSLEQREVNINKEVQIDPTLNEIDVETKLIPAREISKEYSSSADGQATGEKESGENAQGVVDIRNKSTDSKVNLAVGQILTDIATDLDYELTQAVTIPADDYLRDVPIRAVNYGESYNVEDRQVTFKLDGFTTDQIIAFGFRDILGGTTETITVVSESDISSLKEQLEQNMQATLRSQISNEIGTDEQLLPETISFEELESSSSVSAGEEAFNFSLDMKIKAIALKVVDDEIERLATGIILSEESTSGNAEINITNFALNNVKVGEGSLEAELTATGQLNEKVDQEEIKSRIAGGSLEEAEAYLDGIEEITEAQVVYRPEFLPQFFHKVPASTDRIIINIR